jgi:formate dehydrogenase alpha subunit
MPDLTIDGRTARVPQGSTLLDAARALDIDIPVLCHHPDLSIDGSCRLCIVEVDGLAHPVPACALTARDGMNVRTRTPALDDDRRTILEMLLVRYRDADCTDGGAGQNEFMRRVEEYGARAPDPGEATGAVLPVDADPNPFIRVDLNKCILCTRCIRACNEIQGRFVWGMGFRGEESRIVAGLDTTMLDARCESCGACADYCPTGALDHKPGMTAGAAQTKVRTTCPYCGVGCNFDLEIRDGRILRAAPAADAKVNGMHLCVKGRYGHAFVHHADRLTQPLVREYLLNGAARRRGAPRGEWQPVDWDTALQIVAARFAAIRRESGPDAIGVLASAKCTNEENYLMQKFARQVIGTHNIDHCARLCHSSTVAGLAMAYGSGAMSNTMDDVAERAAAYFITGSNITEQHPVFGSRIRRAVHLRGAKLVVADPRHIDIAEFADLHLRQRPGTDVALLNGLMHLILANGWQNDAFIADRTEGFDAFRAAIGNYPPDRVAAITGVPAAQLLQAAEILGRNRPLAVIWAMGITQHTTGVQNVLSLANLQLLLGNMGVPGGGVNPLRGQNNVQGACDMGCLPNVYPGYQAAASADSGRKFAGAWALSGGNGGAAAERPGLTLMEMIAAAGEGGIRALYILGENPAMTDPDVNHVHRCLRDCEFLVLQEIFPSETAEFADVLLPAASWAEKDGTFTNTERRVQLIRAAVPPPGEALADWRITSRLARKMLELEQRTPQGPQSGWNHAGPAEIMAEISALTPSYAGISHARLERGEPLHWPVISADHPGTPILHGGRFTRGKGLFTPCEYLPAEELPDDEYPLYLTTGRVLQHWHGGDMTRRVDGLLELVPESLVEISREDAERIGLNGHRRVRVVSRRGEMIAGVRITDRVAPGLVFGNFHFPGEQNVNNLTIRALDPIAKIPEYKVCAVRVAPQPD